MGFLVSTFNSSKSNSQWSLLHVTTVMGIILKRFLFCFECLFKSAHYFNYSSVKLLPLDIALFLFRIAHYLPEVSPYKSDITPGVDLLVKKYATLIYFFSGFS